MSKEIEPKVVRVEWNKSGYWSEKDRKTVLFRDGVFTGKIINDRHRYSGDIDESFSQQFSLDFFISQDGLEFHRKRQIKVFFSDIVVGRRVKRPSHNPRYKGDQTFKVKPEAVESFIMEKSKEIEKAFHMTEKDMLISVEKLIKNEWKWVHFRSQVELGESIADGLAFVNDEDNIKNYKGYKLIAFEMKTNKDTYARLSKQVNAYLSIVDEVYLVIEDKDIPLDLPFFVGVIRVKRGIGEVIRKPQTLKHSQDMFQIWGTLMKSVSKKAGLMPGNTNHVYEFFKVVENLKRKLVWNQFCKGFHQNYHSSYVPLTELEKKILEKGALLVKKADIIERQKLDIDLDLE